MLNLFACSRFNGCYGWPDKSRGNLKKLRKRERRENQKTKLPERPVGKFDDLNRGHDTSMISHTEYLLAQAIEREGGNWREMQAPAKHKPPPNFKGRAMALTVRCCTRRIRGVLSFLGSPIAACNSERDSIHRPRFCRIGQKKRGVLRLPASRLRRIRRR